MGQVESRVRAVLVWCGEGGNRLLYSRGLSSADWEDLAIVSTVMFLLATAVTHSAAKKYPKRTHQDRKKKLY